MPLSILRNDPHSQSVNNRIFPKLKPITLRLGEIQLIAAVSVQTVSQKVKLGLEDMFCSATMNGILFRIGE